MLNGFYQWPGWYALSTVSELLLAGVAFIAICVALRQSSFGSSEHVGADIRPEMAEDTIGKNKKLAVELYNTGMRYVYVKRIDVEFRIIGGKRSRHTIYEQRLMLHPGESKAIYIKDYLLRETLLNDRLQNDIYVYVFTASKHNYRIKVPFDFESFKFL